MKNWEELTLEAVCLKITDGAHSSPPSVPEGKPMASVKDLTPYGIRLESCRRIPDEDFRKLVKQGCQPMKGDVLIAKDGATALDTVCEVKQTEEVVLLSSVAILRPNPSIVDSSYLHYFLDASSTRSYLKGNFISGAAIPRVVLKDLKRAAIAVPPIPVQQRIAGILSAYDELIENSQRRINILEAMARAIYREWFVHFRFPGHENHPRVASPLGEIPQGWGVKTIQDFGKVITGKTPSKANAAYFGEDVQFLKTPDMHGNMFILNTNERLSTSGAASQANKTLPAGSICVSCIGTVGVVSITAKECQTNQQINSVVLANPASREFLFLRLQDAKQTLENLGSNGATMGNVNKSKFETMEMVSPPLDLLTRYHQIAKPMFAQILALARQIENLRRTRDLLLPRLLSGQIHISHSETRLS